MLGSGAHLSWALRCEWTHGEKRKSLPGGGTVSIPCGSLEARVGEHSDLASSELPEEGPSLISVSSGGEAKNHRLLWFTPRPLWLEPTT